MTFVLGALLSIFFMTRLYATVAVFTFVSGFAAYSASQMFRAMPAAGVTITDCFGRLVAPTGDAERGGDQRGQQAAGQQTGQDPIAAA